MTSGTHYYYHPDTRPKNLSPARRLSDLLLLPPQVAPREKRKKNTLQIFRLFRYSYPSSSLRCSLVASARLCCLSRVPPAVCPSLLESATTVCTFFLQSLLRTYIRRRLIPYYDSGPLHKHQIYVRPIFHIDQSTTGKRNTFHKKRVFVDVHPALLELELLVDSCSKTLELVPLLPATRSGLLHVTGGRA